jgi:MFS family permease
MSSLRNYALVTAAYWAFTLTDGALRMLVLLHFHELGYAPVQLALLFVLYELFGVVTNLFGGWLAARFGLRSTLLSGLGLQVFALIMLGLMNPAWPRAMSVVYVIGAQSLSGIAKDLTKMSAKSTIKVLVPDHRESALFKWVAVLTGSKNAVRCWRCSATRTHCSPWRVRWRPCWPPACCACRVSSAEPR